jgi:hypothetical protein
MSTVALQAKNVDIFATGRRFLFGLELRGLEAWARRDVWGDDCQWQSEFYLHG